MVTKRKLRAVMFQIMAVVILFVSLGSMAADVAAAGATGDEITTIIVRKTGKYKLNYIGSTNYYAWRESNMGVTGEKIYNSAIGKALGAENSATVKLTKSSGAKNIKQAVLVWQTRSVDGKTKKVKVVAPNGSVKTLKAEESCVDKRTVSGLTFNTTYCMAADVTNFVKSGGYGNYTVCNIPVYHPSQDKEIVEKYAKENNLNANTIYPGGETICSWQLIVVEEGKDFPMRNIEVAIGSIFALQKDYAMKYEFAKGITTKASANAAGQILFGCSNYSTSVKMTQTVTTLNAEGKKIKKISGDAIESPGMYKNDSIIRGTDGVANGKGDKTAGKGTGCARVSLEDIESMGGGASGLKINVVNGEGEKDESTKPDSKKGWTTFFLLGVAYDIETADFECGQKTTVDSASRVTITDTFKNSSSNTNTGICDAAGKACDITVNIDPNLSVQSVAAKDTSGTNIAPGKISIDNTNHKVIITGVENTKKNNTVSYEIKCTVASGMSGVTTFENSDSISGNLYSDGVKTAQYLENAAESSSSGIPKYRVALQKGVGIQSVTGAGDYTCGQTVTVSASPMSGYHFLNWSVTDNETRQTYSFSMPAKNVELTANGEANAYTIVFDPNGGAEVSHIGNMTARYGESISLPNANGSYLKYTLDGVNITQDVISGAIVLCAEGTVLEQGEEPQADKKAYESVFLGWALREKKDEVQPQWRAGIGMKVSDLAAAAGVTDINGAQITLYAVWDDCPWIVATNLYYTLEQAQNGFITMDEILSHQTAYDREDGSPITLGTHPDGTSFTIPDYAVTDFTNFKKDGAVTEKLTVTDSSGSVYVKKIWVYVADTTATTVKPEGTTRFINEHYYHEPYELGGLHEKSIWKTDPGYVSALQEGFNHIKNNTPEDVYRITMDVREQIKEYVSVHGYGNSKQSDALQRCDELYIHTNKVNHKVVQG